MSNDIQSTVPPKFDLIRTPVTCTISGVTLGVLEVTIVEGNIPFVQNFSRQELVHPFFGQSDYNLVKKLAESKDFFDGIDWQYNESHARRLQILMCAVMHRLGALKLESPGIPSTAVAMGSASRLLHIANWYLFTTSKRLQLPTYSVSTRNDNCGWENFKFWLDEVFTIHENWQKKVRQYELEEEKKAREESLRQVRSAHTKKINVRGIWDWVRIQMQDHYRQNQLDYWKELFVTGDLCPEDYTEADVEDLIEAIVEHCDNGNEIMHYIRNRLFAIREHIREFFSGFTLVTSVLPNINKTPEELAREAEFFKSYDSQVEDLPSLPLEPKPESFATRGLYLKASAQYRILKSRWDAAQKRGEK